MFGENYLIFKEKVYVAFDSFDNKSNCFRFFMKYKKSIFCKALLLSRHFLLRPYITHGIII